DVRYLRFERALAVEHLDAVVACVGNVDVAGCVAGDPADAFELALAGPRLAPRLEEVAVLVELRDAVVRSKPVSTVDVAGAMPRHIGRPIEAVPVDPDSRRSTAASAAAPTTAFAATATRRGRRAFGRHVELARG